MDKTKKTLDTTTISRPLQTFPITTQHSFPRCSLLGPLYASPTNRRLYTMEKCRFSITSTTFKGMDSVTLGQYLTSSINPLQTYRMSMFGCKLYWAYGSRIISLDTVTGVVSTAFTVALPTGKFVESLVIVHPSLQPGGIHFFIFLFFLQERHGSEHYSFLFFSFCSLEGLLPGAVVDLGGRGSIGSNN